MTIKTIEESTSSNILTIKKEFSLDNEVIANYLLLSFHLDENCLYYIMDDLSYKDSISQIEDYILYDFYVNAILNKRSIFFNKKILLVDEFVIKENFRGKNIGSDILSIIRKEAEIDDYDYIVLKPYPIVNWSFDYSNFEGVYQKVKDFYLKNDYTSLDLAGIDYQYFYQQIKKRND